MDQEALEILEMVKDGRVSAEQGAQLLEALKSPNTALPVVSGQKARFIRVKVNVEEHDSNTVAVNLNLPVALADMALKMLENAKFQRGDQTIAVGEFIQGLGGLDISTLLQMVKEGAAGKLVDVNVSEKEGDKVHVEVTVD